MQKAQERPRSAPQQFRDMVAKFKSMIDAGKLQVEIRNGLMLVKLPDNILFDPGKTDLKPAGQEAIKQVTQILAGIEGRKFQVTGHTDNIPIKSGKFKSNWELSTQRARRGRQVHVDERHGRRSACRPPATPTRCRSRDNDTDDGRRQNRRIEIVVRAEHRGPARRWTTPPSPPRNPRKSSTTQCGATPLDFGSAPRLDRARTDSRTRFESPRAR